MRDGLAVPLTRLLWSLTWVSDHPFDESISQQDSRSVERCLDDPKRLEFSYRSQPYVQPTRGFLNISRSALFNDIQKIWIRVDQDSLPPSVDIFARPYLLRNGKTRFFPYIINPDMKAGDFMRASYRETKSHPIKVFTVDLRKPLHEASS